MTTTAQHLRTIALRWEDLRAALAADTQTPTWPPATLRQYLTQMEHHGREDAIVLRALERDPGQIGERPIPIRVGVYDTMRAIEAALIETADQIAATNQLNGGSEHPHRWRYQGRRTAPYAALWLLARVERRFWPGRALTEAQEQHVARVAAEGARRIEQTLDLADGRRDLTAAHPCQCGGTIEIYGGAGATPIARCQGCGVLWTEAGV
ncbi:hypothetical protein, partial [Streptomyces thermolilacinus]|uniref:hypothetical protein n=1 Tax=Streptomyces thermolilacinus TaxID=285540 RepID=UPI0033D59821